jgi:hypothetical protein
MKAATKGPAIQSVALRYTAQNMIALKVRVRQAQVADMHNYVAKKTRASSGSCPTTTWAARPDSSAAEDAAEPEASAGDDFDFEASWCFSALVPDVRVLNGLQGKSTSTGHVKHNTQGSLWAPRCLSAMPLTQRTPSKAPRLAYNTVPYQEPTVPMQLVCTTYGTALAAQSSCTA